MEVPPPCMQLINNRYPVDADNAVACKCFQMGPKVEYKTYIKYFIHITHDQIATGLKGYLLIVTLEESAVSICPLNLELNSHKTTH